MSPLWTVLVMVLQLVGAVGAPSVQEAASPAEVVIHVTARRFEYRPAEIVVRRNGPVVLELASEDRSHGFNVPELGLRADIEPGAPVRLRFTPDRVGRFPFHCDVYCGSGHEDMTGEIVVTD
jgi:cytochrome c oxidase subunit 2